MTYRPSLTPRDPTHGILVAGLVAEGWQTKGWRRGVTRFLRQAVKDALADEDWGDVEDVYGQIAATYGTPDAWRIVVEGEDHGWGHKVVVVEFAEVEVTSRMTEHKLRHYADLWWAFDSSDHGHFRLWRVDRFGGRCELDLFSTVITVLRPDLGPDGIEAMRRDMGAIPPKPPSAPPTVAGSVSPLHLKPT